MMGAVWKSWYPYCYVLVCVWKLLFTNNGIWRRTHLLLSLKGCSGRGGHLAEKYNFFIMMRRFKVEGRMGINNKVNILWMTRVLFPPSHSIFVPWPFLTSNVTREKSFVLGKLITIYRNIPNFWLLRSKAVVQVTDRKTRRLQSGRAAFPLRRDEEPLVSGGRGKMERNRRVRRWERSVGRSCWGQGRPSLTAARDSSSSRPCSPQAHSKRMLPGRGREMEMKCEQTEFTLKSSSSSLRLYFTLPGAMGPPIREEVQFFKNWGS